MLVDTAGPCDTPITGSRRVMVTDETQRCTLVAYLPMEGPSLDEAGAALVELLGTDPAAP